MAPKTPTSKRESTLIAAIGEQWDERPGSTERMVAARGLGLADEQVPDFATNHELQVWVFRMHALQGSEAHFRELGDRMAPKPGRTNAKTAPRGPTAGAMTAGGAASTAEADEWFKNLGAARGAAAVEESDGEELM